MHYKLIVLIFIAFIFICCNNSQRIPGADTRPHPDSALLKTNVSMHDSSHSPDPVLTDTTNYPWIGNDKSVLGYYLNVPGDYLVSYDGDLLLEKGKDTREAREKLISEKDVKREYLKIRGVRGIKIWEGWMDAGLYHGDTEKDTLLAIFYYSCGPGCKVEFGFLKYRNGKWIDRTEEVFHEVPRQELVKRYSKATHKQEKDVDVPAVLYELHPETNSIDIIADPQFENGNRVRIGSMKWSNEKFILDDDK